MNSQQTDFLKIVAPAAQYGLRTYQVPASITIAQAILESSDPAKGWGQSQLAVEYNNFFGIKAAHYLEPDTYVELPTAEYVSGKKVMSVAAFVRYASPQICFGAHARLLALAPRYRPAMAVNKFPAQFADALQRCGYSTNPKYARTLMQLVTEFNLTQYDKGPEPPQQASAPQTSAQDKSETQTQEKAA